MKIEDDSNPDRPLDRHEYKSFRGITGKLNWLQEITRPDLSFDSLQMSMKTRNATVSDVKKLNKIVRKAKESESIVRFTRIDDFKNLKIVGLADASYRSQDEKVRSVEGRVIMLTNGIRVAPLCWKSKKIPEVCDSTKTAETRACNKATDDAIFIARLIQEIYSGKKSMKQIPVIMYSDSEPLIESIYSTRQVDRKTIRHLIQMLKDTLDNKQVDKFMWVETAHMLADVLTKDSVKNDELVSILRSGKLPRRY